MAKNDNNGFTIKEMLGRLESKMDDNDEKRITENKRIYDKMDEICNHNSEQDGKIEKIEQKQSIMWKGITTAISFLVAGIVGLFFKK